MNKIIKNIIYPFKAVFRDLAQLTKCVNENIYFSALLDGALLVFSIFLAVALAGVFTFLPIYLADYLNSNLFYLIYILYLPLIIMNSNR